MQRLQNELGKELQRSSARFQVECAEDESVYLVGLNVWLLVQSGRYYLATTNDIQALAWTKQLTYKG